MPDEVQPVVRDRERTRRAILEAADMMISEHGANVSLVDIAIAAGITKSGLLHHFKSRDDLLVAVVLHCAQQVWDEVQALVDLSENHAGKLTRAYIRACTGDSEYLVRAFSPTGLLARLGTSQSADELFDLVPQDADRWNAAFAADGLPPVRTTIIRFASEGIVAALGTPYLTDEQLATAREELLAMTLL